LLDVGQRRRAEAFVEADLKVMRAGRRDVEERYDVQHPIHLAVH
jgi:hypothetical protein